MKIKYKVTITNPNKDYMKVTDNLVGEGSFLVKQTPQGVVIQGSYLEDDVEIKAYNHSYLGEGYSLSEKNKLILDYEDYTLTDVTDIFGLFGTNISETPFLKIQKGFKLAKNVQDVYQIDRYVEKSTDVFLVKIDKLGLISRVQGSVTPFSNKVKLDVALASGDILGYFLVSKPLKIDTDSYLFIPNEDLLKLPTGFCRIDNKVVTKNATELIKKNGYLEFSSIIKTQLKFSSFIKLDGVKLTQYSMRENEKVLLEVSEDVSPFSLKNTANNITLIYQITTENTLKPVLALVDKDVDLEYTADDSLYLELKQADPEFHKRYLIKEYSVSLATTHNEYSIINSDVLHKLTNTTEFQGKILKL